MGKGDKKTKRGKISLGSYGVVRPRKKAKAKVASKTAKKTTIAKASAPKKAAPKKAAKKGE